MSQYVDAIAPHHERTSCSDEDLYNAAYGIDDRGGYGHCYRCTLLRVVLATTGEDEKFND
jgi:hypothetical protein